MTSDFASEDSSRSRHPQCVGTIRQKTVDSEVPLNKKLYANEELIFGRDPRRCQVIFDDPSISNKHLRIYSIIFDQDQGDEIPPLVYAEDISRNGAYWNGTLMGVGNGGFLLSHKDILKLSKTVEIEFHCPDSPTGEPLEKDQRDAGEIIFDKKYTITDRKIGSGGFGQVYMAINNFNHRQVACKIVPLDKIKEHFDACEKSRFKFGRWERPTSAKKVSHKREMMKLLSWKKRTTLAHQLTEKLKTYDREVEILQSLDHPNIVRLEKVFKTSNYLYLFQELVTGGDLFSFLEYKNGKLLDVEAAVIIRQILKAVEHLHDQGIVHRDLKPDNILMTSLANGSRVVLTDFGGARRIDKDMKRMTTTVGTREFIAPEVLGRNKALSGKQGYTEAADMWSLGCVTVILLTGGSIFRDPTTGAYCDKVASECNLDLLNNDPDWKYVGERPKDFVRGLLVLDEDKRMTAKQALEHSWFTNDMNKANFEDVYQRAIKNWKPRMVIGTVVEDFDVDSEANKASMRPVKRSRNKSGVPVDPPYKPAPKNFFQTFYPPKKKSFGSVEDYIQASRGPSEIPEAASSAPTPRTSPTLHPKSQDLALPIFFRSPHPRKPADALHTKRVMKKLAIEPVIVAKEVDYGTPLEGGEDTSVDPSSQEVLLDCSVLRENGAKKNQRWPFSPGAWDWGKSSSASRTISRELSPPKSKSNERLAKKFNSAEKLKPISRVTPGQSDFQNGTSYNENAMQQDFSRSQRYDTLNKTATPSVTNPTNNPLIPVQGTSPKEQHGEPNESMPPPSWQRSDRTKASLIQNGALSNLPGKSTLKRVSSFGLGRNEPRTKKKRSGSVFDMDEEEEEEEEEEKKEEATHTLIPNPKKRKREGSIFDFPNDNDDAMEPYGKQQANNDRNEKEQALGDED